MTDYEAVNTPRVQEDDPNRCQAIMKTAGQCRNRALPGGTVCLMHGGNAQERSQNAEKLRNYRLTKFQAQLERHSDSPIIKNLRDEIAILRMALETRLNQCTDESDFIMQSGPISDLVMKIERLVSSCHKLEGAMGNLLDKQAILQFANELITLVNTVVSEALQAQPDVKDTIINRLANGILTLVGTTTGEKDAPEAGV